MSARLFETRIDVALPQGLPAARRLRVRSLLYKMHLWLGALSMAYLLLISVSGCVILFGQELHGFFAPAPQLAANTDATRLSSAELKQMVQLDYLQAAVVALFDKELPSGTAAEVWIEQHDVLRRRLYDPYTGADLGDAQPWTLHLLAWLRTLHTELLGGSAGRVFNSLGAFALIALSVSGAMMGWKRLRQRRQSKNEDIQKNRRFAALHRIVGVWTLLFALMWGITGASLAWPALLRVSGAQAALGGDAFRTLYNLHFGSIGGWPTRILWAISAMALAVLAVTGAVLWWKRTHPLRAGRLRIPNELPRGTQPLTSSGLGHLRPLRAPYHPRA